MARFSINIVGNGLPTHPYAACFEDVAFAMRDALRRLGHEVTAYDGPTPGRYIIFGAQNLYSVNDPRDPGSFLPEDAILFNSEQIAATGSFDGKSLFGARSTWKKRVVWDYSQSNVETLRGMGMERMVHCPLGYIDTMAQIPRAAVQDIDVLFYGSVAGNDRRRQILSQLEKAGLKVKHLFRVFGAERDQVIARSKVVLNVHFYEGAVFEIFRVSHLLANSKCVVSESGWRDPGLEALARASTMYVPYDGLTTACQALVAREDLRREQEIRGHERFKREDFAESVRQALVQS